MTKKLLFLDRHRNGESFNDFKHRVTTDLKERGIITTDDPASDVADIEGERP